MGRTRPLTSVLRPLDFKFRGEIDDCVSQRAQKTVPFARASLLLSSLPPFLSSFSFFLLKKIIFTGPKC